MSNLPQLITELAAARILPSESSAKSLHLLCDFDALLRDSSLLQAWCWILQSWTTAPDMHVHVARYVAIDVFRLVSNPSFVSIPLCQRRAVVQLLANIIEVCVSCNPKTLQEQVQDLSLFFLTSADYIIQATIAECFASLSNKIIVQKFCSFLDKKNWKIKLDLLKSIKGKGLKSAEKTSEAQRLRTWLTLVNSDFENQSLFSFQITTLTIDESCFESAWIDISSSHFLLNGIDAKTPYLFQVEVSDIGDFTNDNSGFKF